MPIYQLTEELVFPPPHLAEEGLLAVGGDLSEERLLLAYANGIFPWYSEDEPILWWSSDPRTILLPDELHIARRLRRVLNQGLFRISFDTAFTEVVQACATAPRKQQEGTWITAEMQAAYIRLHASGFAHSVECWQDGDLVGGLYGVSLGASFFGESMFSHQPNASKVALATLCEQLQRWDFGLIDCQVDNPHLTRLGAREISRDRFLKILGQTLRCPTRRGSWGHASNLNNNIDQTVQR